MGERAENTEQRWGWGVRKGIGKKGEMGGLGCATAHRGYYLKLTVEKQRFRSRSNLHYLQTSLDLHSQFKQRQHWNKQWPLQLHINDPLHKNCLWHCLRLSYGALNCHDPPSAYTQKANSASVNGSGMCSNILTMSCSKLLGNWRRPSAKNILNGPTGPENSGRPSLNSSVSLPSLPLSSLLELCTNLWSEQWRPVLGRCLPAHPQATSAEPIVSLAKSQRWEGTSAYSV